MAKYVLTNKAVQDLSKIWRYTLEHWSEKQADKYYKALIFSCEELAENPKLGKDYNMITKNLLGKRSDKHIIFYRIISEDHIEITRVLHGRMDLKQQLLK